MLNCQGRGCDLNFVTAAREMHSKSPQTLMVVPHHDAKFCKWTAAPP